MYLSTQSRFFPVLLTVRFIIHHRTTLAAGFNFSLYFLGNSIVLIHPFFSSIDNIGVLTTLLPRCPATEQKIAYYWYKNAPTDEEFEEELQKNYSHNIQNSRVCEWNFLFRH